jgi:hypothetical protein
VSDTASEQQHLLFLWAPTGYQLVERAGEPPAVGSEVELDGRTERVTKVGASPLPGDTRPCAYLIA